ncbi:hypothetical protein AAF712_014630 [Marasmius tenuissimus]|uniref:Uncharacterized protein n=1 Tax=Marasmius tenuissimus TaxID=585030 RepID=A0ABR2ZAL1_9AGAR
MQDTPRHQPGSIGADTPSTSLSRSTEADSSGDIPMEVDDGHSDASALEELDSDEDSVECLEQPDENLGDVDSDDDPNVSDKDPDDPDVSDKDPDDDADSSYEPEAVRPVSGQDNPDELVHIQPGCSAEGELVEQPTQVQDYRFRSSIAHDVCLWDYVAQIDKLGNGADGDSVAESDDSDCENDEFDIEVLNVEVLNNVERLQPRGPLLHGHPQHQTHINTVRQSGKRFVPVPLGPPIPRKDKEELKEKHAWLMLILFKPWREVQDLRAGFGAWSEAYGAFCTLAGWSQNT